MQISCALNVHYTKEVIAHYGYMTTNNVNPEVERFVDTQKKIPMSKFQLMSVGAN